MQRQGDLDEATEVYGQCLMINRDVGDKTMSAMVLHHLGTVAQIRGRYHDAVRLYAVAAVLHGAARGMNPHTLTNPADYERDIHTVRVLLDEESFSALWAEGEVLTEAQAMKLALTGHTQDAQRAYVHCGEDSVQPAAIVAAIVAVIVAGCARQPQRTRSRRAAATSPRLKLRSDCRPTGHQPPYRQPPLDLDLHEARRHLSPRRHPLCAGPPPRLNSRGLPNRSVHPPVLEVPTWQRWLCLSIAPWRVNGYANGYVNG